MKSSGTHLFTIVAAIAIGTSLPSAHAQDAGDAVAGRRVAQTWCANCHAFPGSTHVTATGAPSFPAIGSNSALTPLALRAFLQTPHDRMPDLHLTNNEMDDLIAFIRSARVR
jgi:mono/diheme cytochrome c family protein